MIANMNTLDGFKYGPLTLAQHRVNEGIVSPPSRITEDGSYGPLNRKEFDVWRAAFMAWYDTLSVPEKFAWRNRPDIEALRREYRNRPEVKEARRAQQREYFQRPEVKERMREQQREYQQRDDVKERRNAQRRERNARKKAEAAV